MKIYSLGYLLKEGVRSLWTNRTMTLASVCVLISCLLLTGTAVLFSMNIATAMEDVENSNSITVYLDDNLPQLKAVEVGEQLRQLDNIASCDYVPKDEALKDILSGMGDEGSVFEGLTGSDNFLPDAYRISFEDISKYDETIAAIESLEGVKKYTDFSQIIERLNSIDHMVRIFGVAVVVVLGIVSLFIISNTIKVTMFSRRLEISIMKSVGATNMFVRIPFLVEGMLIGLISSLLATLVIGLAYVRIMEAIVNVIPFFTPVVMDTFFWPMLGYFVLAGVLFGMMGGLISIRRYLKHEGSLAAA